ncbi:hypothetical protein LguiB_013945 [Lonicera macranthoides]
MIYPIFYDVEPNEVQHPESGSYKDAFLEHKKDEKLNEEIVQQWMKALETIGDLKGWELKKVTNSHEGELVKVIVENILLELKKNYTHEPQNLIGMDNRIEEWKRLLKVDSNGVRIVGIHGMGGLGKTTIAKVIYNHLCERLQRCCFLDVQDNSKQDKDIVNLQNQLLSKIQKREVPKLDDFHQGRDKIRDTVREKKVLLVLDNVDRYFQINMLVGDHNWFGDQSLIIITTRNKEVLDIIEKNCQTKGRVEVYIGYRPELLNDKDSLKLFCKHAFRRDSPLKDYEIISRKFVSIAAKLPLGINVLIRRSLLTIGYDDTLIMHDSLRDLGKKIIHEEGLSVLSMRSRLQDDEALQVLKAHQGTKHIQVLHLDSSNFELDDDFTKPEQCLMSGKLKVLILSNCRYFSRAPHLSAFSSLEVLELESCWMLYSVDGLEQLKLLKYLNTSGCPSLERLPDLSKLTKLQSLNVKRYYNLIAIQGLDRLASLEYLDTSFCISLEELPDFSNSRKLKHLDIKDVDIQGLDKLESSEYLEMSFSKSIKILPDLPNFGMLKYIGLHCCEELQDVETLRVVAESLESLDLSYCNALMNMPDLTMLKKLKKLNISSLEELTELQGIEKLKSL